MELRKFGSAKNCGNLIAKLRTREGLSQQQLANRLDIPRKIIVAIENGLKLPSHEQAVKIAQELGGTNNLFS